MQNEKSSFCVTDELCLSALERESSETDDTENRKAICKAICFDSMEHSFILHWKELVRDGHVSKIEAKYALLQLLQSLDCDM